MPPRAALTIPSPLESYARVWRLKDLAAQRRASQQDLAAQRRAAQQEAEENGQIQQVLRRVQRPEDFDAIWSDLAQINVEKAYELRALHQRAFPTPAAPGTRAIETVDEAGRPVRRLVEDRPGQTFPIAPNPPATSLIDTVDETGRPVRRVIEQVPGQTFPMPPPTSRATPGSFEDFLAAPPEAREQMMAARRAYTAAGQAPPREGPTEWQEYQEYVRQQMEAQRQRPRTQLDARGDPAQGPYQPPLSPEAWRERRLRGRALGPAELPPEALGVGRPDLPRPEAPMGAIPAPGMTLGGLVGGGPSAPPPPPAAPPPMAPAPPPAASAAPAVADPAPHIARLLAQEPPGEYDLSDGSVWVKDAQGRVRRLR